MSYKSTHIYIWIGRLTGHRGSGEGGREATKVNFSGGHKMTFMCMCVIDGNGLRRP